MRIVAIVFGLLILAGTILLVVAGASGKHGSNAMGPLAFLLCIVAVAVMIVLGVTLGGRNNPRRAPHSQAATTTQAATSQVPAPANDRDEPGDQA